MFEKLWGMLQELEEAQGSKAKTTLLKRFVEDRDFVWMVKNALDQGHSFGIEAFPDFRPPRPDYTPSKASDICLLIVKRIEELKSKPGVTDADVSELYNLLTFSEAAYNVVLRILRKDLRCGVAAKTINKVSPNLIFRVPYQRCAGIDHVNKISFKLGAILQRKANGMFVYLLPDGTFMTRKGERAIISGNPVAPFVAQLPGLNDKVLAVELVVLDEEGKVLPRAVGNGLLNSFFKGKGDPAAATKVRAYTWLYLTPREFAEGRGQTPYRYMWDNLTQMIPPLNSPIMPIESWYVKTIEEAMQKTRQLIAAGEEGTVLKSMSEDYYWADEDPSYFQVKLKAQAECEFIIMGAYEGDPNKKYAGQLGGIKVQSRDGLIVSDVGGGFSDAQRKEGVSGWSLHVGDVCTVKFYGITEPNAAGVSSLDHPQFIEIRDDKTEADDYDTIKKAILGVVE